jgi:DNA-binding CsgD family transcriptional regulator
MTQTAQLVGRNPECSAVDELLRQVTDGASGALVVRGEPGIGKSAILDYAAKTAGGFLVLAVTGIESEMEVVFSGLQQACAPLAGRLGQLPAPQADALRVAFGLTAATAPPERFLVGLGVLGLLAEAAAARPVLCLVDDAQWIDQASLRALGFAARRLQRESVAMIFGARAGFEVPELAGLTELTLGGLTEADARALLTAAVPGRLDEQVQDRIVAEAAGNPLALLEFSHEITESGDLAGGFGVSPWVTRPLADRVAERFLARVAALPAATRRLLLLAAAEPLGDPGLLRRAGLTFGTNISDLAPAELAGLVRLGAQVTFRHPLVRSAIYRSAPAVDRQAAHAALAEATVAEHDQDRRAWHRAHATLGPDEAAAADLERSANRALTRGGPAAAAAFLERAAALSPDPGERARRNLAAAQSKYDAGSPGAAGSLISAAVAGPIDELQRARADQLAARIATVIRTGGDPPGLLLQAARRFGPLDAALARRTYLDAIMSAMILGDPRGTRWLQVAGAARGAPPAPASARPRSDDLLLDGLAALANDGYQAALPGLRDALRAFRTEDPEGARSTGAVGVLWLACQTAMNLWDDASWIDLSGRLLALARGNGALIDYGGALNIAALVAVLSGDFTAAAACNDESDVIAVTTQTYAPVHGRLALAAWQGREGAVAVPGSGDRGTNRTVRQYTAALLGNSLGRYEEALAAAEPCCENADHLGYPLWALPELAEAAARCGRADLAEHAVARLAETTAASGTDWGLGMLARSRALVSAGESAETGYLEAIDRLGRTRIKAHLARAHLLYGEWLRRAKRRSDARAQLRIASEMFTAMGAGAFAARTDRELAATGERVRRRDIQPVVELTPQETQIARLASEGRSNPEIAAQLYLSPRTVEYHLSKIFAKLDIASRGHLARALAARLPRHRAA